MKIDQILDSIFSYYDRAIGGLSPVLQAGISLLLLAFLIWQIYMFIKSGHWIFLAVILAFSPGTWPATKQIGLYIYLIVKFLLVRAQTMLY